MKRLQRGARFYPWEFVTMAALIIGSFAAFGLLFLR
jgi:hypothetical protein